MAKENKQHAVERARDEHPKAQYAAAAVQGINELRRIAMQNGLSNQEEALHQALGELGKVRDFVATPDAILGSTGTKHGEIAEMLEVHGRNARDLLRGLSRSASEASSRFAPEDYRIAGTAVQSKFINGLNNNLDHVLEHLGKYPEWGEQGEYYHIPRDHFEQIAQVLRGENPEGLNARTLNAIREKAAEIERRTGQSFDQMVRPSEWGYGEVMPGRIHETLDGRERDMKAESERLEDGIREAGKPSVQEGLKGAAVAVAVSGGVTFASGVYGKWRGGKNPFRGEFTNDDWKEIGLTSSTAAAGSGVSVFSIYCLTNFAKTPAPLAGAYVSAATSVLTLARSCQAGTITAAELAELAPLACVDAAAVALASVAGQTLVPIPVVGMMLGATAARMCLSLVPDQNSYLSAKAELANYYDQATAKIRATQVGVVETILAEYDRLGDLTEVAFDLSRNEVLLLQSSIELAGAYSVPSEQILRSTTELDSYMLD